MKTITHLKTARGFTLTEVIVAMALSVIVGGAAVHFIVQGTRASLRTASSTTNDLVQWSISSRLQIDSKMADGAVIYPDFTTANIDFSKRCTNSGATGTRSRGHLLVLSLSSNPDGSKASNYERITGYVFSPSAKTLSKFEYNVSATEQAAQTDLETIIKNNMSTFVLSVIATDVEALDAEGPFISRDLKDRNVNAAAATFKLSQGNAALMTKDSVLVDIAFRIRS